MAAKDEILEI